MPWPYLNTLELSGSPDVTLCVECGKDHSPFLARTTTNHFFIASAKSALSPLCYMASQGFQKPSMRYLISDSSMGYHAF